MPLIGCSLIALNLRRKFDRLSLGSLSKNSIRFLWCSVSHSLQFISMSTAWERYKILGKYKIYEKSLQKM